MSAWGLTPAATLVAATAVAIVTNVPAGVGWGLPVPVGLSWLAWAAGWRGTSAALLVASCAVAGLALGADARAGALAPSLRRVLDESLDGVRAGAVIRPHDPVRTSLRLVEDASAAPGGATLRAETTAVRVGDDWRAARGGVIVSVRGQAAKDALGQWTAGRQLVLPVTWRRATRYLNDGLADAERALALDGVTLFASAKSALLVEDLARGSPLAEAAAEARRHVRRRVGRWVAPHGAVSASIVTAILIGDRTGLPPAIRDRLQAAGTYHVIAISGGNVAILVGLVLWGLSLLGASRRLSALGTLVVLVLYVSVVAREPSVWRAALMAGAYLGARLLDHRIPPWQAVAVAALLAACAAPADVRAVGFLLTFGATVALLEVARVVAAVPRLLRAAGWLVGGVLATLAVEALLLPVFANAFGRVTAAGIALNLLAVPLMTVVQVAGMVAVLAPGPDALVSGAGWTAHVAAAAIVESARLVDVAPWLVRRVPPAAPALVVLYYAGIACAWRGRRRLRQAGVVAWVVAGAAIVGGAGTGSDEAAPKGRLRLTMFDVGQGEAMLLEGPDGTRVLVDAGGQPFGEGAEIGARVLVPALRARGVRRLDLFVMTHADPDHLGGGRAVLDALAPAVVWEGVPVPDHPGRADFLAAARRVGAVVETRYQPAALSLGRARVRVLHPAPPDWRRPRVRNDDSLVLEVVHGDVALLLTGDISADVERALLPRLTPARHRILKVAHHGSRFSTGAALVEGWRPQIALVSAGRGNTFGHPAPDVLARLEAAGVRVLRTDLHGQITVETDGRTVRVRTYVEE